MEDHETTTTETTQTTWTEVAAESAKTEQEVSRPPRNFRTLLPVPLTEGELAAHAKKAAAARAMVSEYEARKKDAADHWKAKIELAENERDGFLDAIAEGTEERMVEVVETFNFRLNTVTVTRVDTNEKVSERAMSFAERQPSLPGVERDEGDTEDGESDEDGDAVTEANDDDLPDFDSESDADGNVIKDPQAVLDGEPAAVATKKRERRAKKKAAKK